VTDGLDRGLPSRRESDARCAASARQLVDALRGADGRAAEAIARGALADGLTAAGVHARVVAPAMYRIGELWERNLITVADEHLATAIAHRVLAALYLANHNAVPGGRATVVLAAPAGQHHGLGLRMAADVLEAAGYTVIYLGTNVPVPALASTVATYRPAVVGLSLTMAFGAEVGHEAMVAVKRVSPDTHVLFGGQGVPRRWIAAGVGYVANVECLVGEVERLTAGTATASADAIGGAAAPREPPPSNVKVGVGTAEDHMLDAAIDMGQLVREQARLAAQFRALAFQDHLCGLPNRRAFDDRFAELTAGDPGGLALMLLDVDTFKQINDRFGHDEGDDALRLVAEALRGRLRASDMPARLGGDEFAALLPAVQTADAHALAADLQQRIAERCRRNDLTVSIGIAWFDGDRRRTMLQADQALYRAKSLGGNQICLVEAAAA
jgi:diguanylate cyclase (GGDEF)-like protein